jgi:hypothetical protein
MGGFSSQVQQPQTSQPQNAGGKGAGQATDFAPPTQQYQQPPQPMGKGGAQTNSATSGQPRMGMQNQYSNTVGQWDNSQIQPLQPKNGGKGKGG